MIFYHKAFVPYKKKVSISIQNWLNILKSGH